jgi:hypothetical protein
MKARPRIWYQGIPRGKQRGRTLRVKDHCTSRGACLTLSYEPLVAAASLSPQLSLPADVHEGQESDGDRAADPVDEVTVREVPEAEPTLNRANKP